MSASMSLHRSLRRLWRMRLTIAGYAGVLILAMFSILIPFWMVLVNSFKPSSEANALGLGLPATWQTLENYRTVLLEGQLLRGFRNTMLLGVPAVGGMTLLGALAAWVFARSSSRLIGLLYYFAIGGILIPPAIVPSIYVMRGLGIQGTRIGLMLFYIGIWIAFAIFLMTGFVKTIPRELEEAARIDGAGFITTFTKIILPLLVPVLATVIFIMLLFVWNDFVYAFFLLKGIENRTLVLGLFNFVSGYEFVIRWNLVFADVVLTSVPLVLLFLFTQRYVVSGLMGVSAEK